MADAFFLEATLDRKLYKKAFQATERLAKKYDISFRDLNPVFRREWRRYLDQVIARARQRHSTQWSPGSRLPSGDTRGRLHVRSGFAMASLTSNVRVFSAGDVRASITGAPYLAAHEFGARIRSRRADGFLTIPLPAAMNAKGIPLRRSLSDWQDTFLRPTKDGGYLVLQKRRGGKPVPIYILKRSVRIRRRLGLRKDLERTGPAFAQRLIEELAKSIARRSARSG